jgi:DNA-directed RNA polymerase specialized sigma24 family protein
MRITKSHEIAEEIVVDVFLKLWMGRELTLHIRNMEAFLSTVACNKAMNFFRLTARNQRLQKVVEESMELGMGGNLPITICWTKKPTGCSGRYCSSYPRNAG